MDQYLALLRGINVGGNNIIKMADLADCFTSIGLKNVRTYIQSGNVLFTASTTDPAALTLEIESALTHAFHYSGKVVLRSHAQLKNIVAGAPEGFGSQPALYRCDVIFLKEPLTASQAMSVVSIKEGVDQAFPGDGVLYFSRLISRATSSHLSRIIGTPTYQNMTIRNWNTTTKLLALLDSPTR